ncbi:hypothetical protein CSUI_006181, partial [Cystoisospora suis]
MSAGPSQAREELSCSGSNPLELAREGNLGLRQHVGEHHPGLQVYVHLSRRASESDLPLLLRSALEQEAQLERHVVVLTYDARQQELRRAAAPSCEESTAPRTDRSSHFIEQLRAVEGLMALLQHTCIIYMPSEIVTHGQLLHRSQEGSQNFVYSR